MTATAQDHSSAPTPVVNGPTRQRRFWPLEFYRSAVGKKWAMAVTGIALLGYVLVHMIGNLKLYLGAGDLNHYGEFLRELLEPIFPRTVLLWLLRIGLLGAFVLHIHAAYSLTRMNQRANASVTSAKYATGRDYVAANFASRTMRWTGTITLLYVIFHLADLTWGTANPDYVRGDPYNNLVASFERVPVALLYIVTNVAVGIHVFHGAWSMFQSLGLNNPRFNRWRVGFARGLAAVIVVGNVSFPLAVMVGAVERDDAEREFVCEETDNTGDPCTDVASSLEEASP